MIRSHWFLFPVLAAALAATGAAGAQASSPCEKMASFKLEGGAIRSARLVAAGQFPAPERGAPESKALFPKLPAFCRVEATLTPSADSAIRIEVWLPVAGWNGKLTQAGNGAYAGELSYGGLAAPLLAGYAATGSDTGHEGGSAAFAIGHPEKLIDFGYRAVHENAVAAKAIVSAYYGSAAKRAYFEGCSTGGRQAYGEAQRYPADFDGIVAGDPGFNTTHQTAMQTWVGVVAHQPEAAFIPAEKYKAFHAAVLEACDALDGVKDGVIENPLQCKFDPGTLLCKGADAPDCLTAPQVEFARKIYAGPVSPSGKKIFPGLLPGSEVGWNVGGGGLAGDKPMGFAADFYRLILKENPQWDPRTLDLDADVTAADQKLAATINNHDPNVKAFFARGGKLIGYHGWADPGISALSSIGYFQSVAKATLGSEKIANSYRLFLIPGMLHCGGGDGTSSFNMLAALDAWVDQGKAPDSIPAARVRNGQTDRTRPLCPFPQQAVYKGSGSSDEAANFTCKVK